MKQDFLRAARCPDTLSAQSFGLWTIERRECPSDPYAAGMFRLATGGYNHQTALCRLTEETMHQEPGEVVMEDSVRELSRHLPIWLNARGRVLISGLGLGCVVRGLLASLHVSHIDVIELDRDIIHIVGAEFADNPRVTLHHGDALKWEIPTQASWDFAWHDIWCEGGSLPLHRLHLRLIDRYLDHCETQGAWMLPRVIKRRVRQNWRLVG